ncbi:MAG: hypothetical protein WCK47_00925 [bacterium]|nr:hypothetical protein [Candidatus Sumerlaeota bacterium]
MFATAHLYLASVIVEFYSHLTRAAAAWYVVFLLLNLEKKNGGKTINQAAQFIHHYNDVRLLRF